MSAIQKKYSGKLILAIVVALLANVSIMAQVAALDFATFVGTAAWADWRADGDYDDFNGKEMKEGIINESNGKYITIQSTGLSTDPMLYYYWSGWNYLGDDYNGDANFRAVVHFVNSIQYGFRLGYAHFSPDDLGFYSVKHHVSDTDPDLHGVYYVEVVNGTATKVWHP